MDAGSGWLSGKEKFRRRRLVIEAAVRDARRQRLGDDREGIRAFLVKEITASGEPLPADWTMETLIDRVRADDMFSHARTSAAALARLARKAAERREGIAGAMRAAGGDTEPAELMVVEPDRSAPLIDVALNAMAAEIIDPHKKAHLIRERQMVFLNQIPEGGEEGISVGMGGCSLADRIGIIPIGDGRPFLEVLHLAAAQGLQVVIEGICGNSDGNWTLAPYRPLTSAGEPG